MASFPDVNAAAIDDLAVSLKQVSSSMADIGLDVKSLRGSVMGSQQWQGSASEKWYAVVTERVGDAGLTNDVMGSASSMLSTLASELEAERRTYDRLSSQLYMSKPVSGPESRFIPTVQVVDPDVQRAMDACAERAAQLLDNAARQLLSYAVIAGDVRAVPAANRTPDIPDGTNRQAASLHLLAMLFGSVTGNRTSGVQFEEAVLQALGISKNTTLWRPDPAFEGKLTASGLARGTIVDGWGNNYLLEIKGTSSLQLRFQLRLQLQLARLTNNPLWIVKAAGQKADPSVVRDVEARGGGVLYTSDNGKTYEDGNGNPVKVTYDKATDKLDVSGYKPSGGGAIASSGSSDPGSAQAPDPDAPSGPVNPSTADAPPAAADMPTEPVVPEDPVPPVDPEIIP